jgi:hypothetical protein
MVPYMVLPVVSEGDGDIRIVASGVGAHVLLWAAEEELLPVPLDATRLATAPARDPASPSGVVIEPGSLMSIQEVRDDWVAVQLNPGFFDAFGWLPHARIGRVFTPAASPAAVAPWSDDDGGVAPTIPGGAWHLDGGTEVLDAPGGAVLARTRDITSVLRTGTDVAGYARIRLFGAGLTVDGLVEGAKLRAGHIGIGSGYGAGGRTPKLTTVAAGSCLFDPVERAPIGVFWQEEKVELSAETTDGRWWRLSLWTELGFIEVQLAREPGTAAAPRFERCPVR